MSISPQAAVEQLFELYGDEIYRYALLTLRDPAEAEDATQEVFIKVLRAWARFRNEANVRTWMWTIARNTIYDITRKQRRYQRLINDAQRVPLFSAHEDLALEIEDVLRHLPVDQRHVILLIVLQGYSVSETARIAGYSESKVRRLLKKSQALLTESLRDEVNGPAKERGTVCGAGVHQE